MIPIDWRVLILSLGVVWLAYVYVGYPALLVVIGLVKRVRPEARDDYFPTVSVLIAARNEERDIGWKVRETLAWDYPAGRLEVLVASDASEDGTDEIVRSIDDSRLKLLRMDVRGGKNCALNRLASKARGELLFFTDANAHIGSGGLRKMTAHFADAQVGCVTGSTSAACVECNEGAIGKGAGIYWGYESFIQWLESRIGSVLVCDGAIFCARASLFRPLFPEIANDVQTSMDVASTGQWVIYEPAARAIEADTSSPREEMRRRRRICGQGVLAMHRLRSRMSVLRQWQFVSRKFLRWLTLLPMLMVFASSLALAHNPIFFIMTTIQAAFYMAAFVGWILARTNRAASRLISVPFYIVLGVAGALLGAADAALGRRFAVWDIPTLSRGQEGA
jgi:cellulose synthase/poly-beta-1,6-N-acetylglucosamine synthase-like glycosyltransferase